VSYPVIYFLSTLLQSGKVVTPFRSVPLTGYGPRLPWLMRFGANTSGVGRPYLVVRSGKIALANGLRDVYCGRHRFQ